ncbi:MAG: hypothetical protein Q9195_006054 [Heterodermia aff. obscurata]
MLSLTIVGVLAAFSLLLYKYILHPLFLSPLSRIPGAYFTSHIIPLQAWSNEDTGANTRAIFTAHQKHGPVVRLGPNEISCVTPTALRVVYTGGFEKEKFYEDVFVNYGIPPMFAKLASKPHSVRKRMMTNLYSKSLLQTSPDMDKLSHCIIYDKLLPILRSRAGPGSQLDVFDFNQAIGMDFISAYLFGLSHGTDFMNNVDYRHHWYKVYNTSINTLPQERRNGELETWCLQLCEAANRSLCSNDPGMDSKLITQPVIFAHVFESLSQTPEAKADPHHAMLATASEMLDHLIAGHETSAITLTYLMLELSRRPDLQARLRKELLTLDPPILTDDTPIDNLPSPRSIDALPLLDSILQETLRLHAAGPARQPRVTPHAPRPRRHDHRQLRAHPRRRGRQRERLHPAPKRRGIPRTGVLDPRTVAARRYRAGD